MKKLLLAGTAALLMLSTSAHASPYEGALEASRQYKATHPVVAPVNPYEGALEASRQYQAKPPVHSAEECFAPVDYGPPPNTLPPRAAEFFKQKAEAAINFRNSKFCEDQKQKAAEKKAAQEKAAAEQREKG